MASKLERLLNLIAALLDAARPLSAEELRQRVDGYAENLAAFRRAFERDKEELRAMGIPLAVEPVPGSDPPVDGYRIHRAEYAGIDPQLEPDELAALHLAASLVRVDGLDDEAFFKLGGVTPTDTATGPVVSVPTSPALVPLFEAAATGGWVRFGYHGTDRLVLPQRLTFQRGHWYLSAFDATRQGARLFRVDRIEGAVAGARPPAGVGEIPAPPPVVLSGWALGDEEPVVARVLVDADQAAWARHEVGSDAEVEERPDGSVVLTVPVRNRRAFRSFVLSFLEHAEVLEPPDLRDEMVTWLETMVATEVGP